MNGMKIAICDDEKIMQEYLKEEIDSYFQSLDVLTLCYSSGEELLADYEKQQYDMVFLDIEMKGLNGLQVAKLLHAWKKDLPIVMVTTHTELAMEGYEVQAFRFLAKPFCAEMQSCIRLEPHCDGQVATCSDRGLQKVCRLSSERFFKWFLRASLPGYPSENCLRGTDFAIGSYRISVLVCQWRTRLPACMP